ncbi:MAG: PepSY domain-containing protein [Comamonadaceae bacterium]|jgi:uncharacterized membrane protein YkoI|nr:PepSY domain-containing protein [Comamonadaceae bacterium]
MRHHTISLTLLAAVLAASGAATYAAQHEAGNDALAAAQAPITLTQAIAAAEQHVNGKAAKAEFERGKHGAAHYEVEVVQGTQVFDVQVDAHKGTVIASQLDRHD